MTDERYLLNNSAPEAGTRFNALSALFDPSTFRHLDDLGVGEGWRCWEVGAGGPTVTRWLAERVGPRGYVLGTDIDISWMQETADRTVELRLHDVALDDPPGGDFDLVHARLVLVHVPGRAEALRRMVRALRPGGWLLIEDADPALQPLGCLDAYGPEQILANKLRKGLRTLLSDRGVDLAYGRKLPRLLRAVGLTEIRADAYFPIAMPECAALESATVAMLCRSLIERGLATSEEITLHLANMAKGRLDLVTSPMVSAWGQRPSPA